MLPALIMTIWTSCLLLLVSFSLMLIQEEIEAHPEILQEEQEIQKDLHDIRKEAVEITHALENKPKTNPPHESGQ